MKFGKHVPRKVWLWKRRCVFIDSIIIGWNSPLEVPLNSFVNFRELVPAEAGNFPRVVPAFFERGVRRTRGRKKFPSGNFCHRLLPNFADSLSSLMKLELARFPTPSRNICKLQWLLFRNRSRSFCPENSSPDLVEISLFTPFARNVDLLVSECRMFSIFLVDVWYVTRFTSPLVYCDITFWFGNKSYNDLLNCATICFYKIRF